MSSKISGFNHDTKVAIEELRSDGTWDALVDRLKSNALDNETAQRYLQQRLHEFTVGPFTQGLARGEVQMSEVDFQGIIDCALANTGSGS